MPTKKALVIIYGLSLVSLCNTGKAVGELWLGWKYTVVRCVFILWPSCVMPWRYNAIFSRCDCVAVALMYVLCNCTGMTRDDVLPRALRCCKWVVVEDFLKLCPIMFSKTPYIYNSFLFCCLCLLFELDWTQLLHVGWGWEAGTKFPVLYHLSYP